jgi:hypothetical protein
MIPVHHGNEQSLTFRHRFRLHGVRETIFVVRDINYYLGIFTRMPLIWRVAVHFFKKIHSNPTTTYIDYALLSSKYMCYKLHSLFLVVKDNDIPRGPSMSGVGKFLASTPSRLQHNFIPSS